MGRQTIDLTGRRFGRLTVVEQDATAPSGAGRCAKWICRCDCGNETTVYSSNLLRGITKSCGCYRSDRLKTHGATKSRLYRIWCTMKARCKSDQYEFYHGRGITVCDEWLNSFQAFYDWAIGNGYKDDLSIDRIDNNKGYHPQNCRWATAKEQANNTRKNIRIEFDGYVHTLAEWSTIVSIPYATLYYRIVKQHLSAENAFTR